MKKTRIGFLINPIAGMGGRVGLKGTDGDAYYEALRRGAEPVAPKRAMEFLGKLDPRTIRLLVAPGPMGWYIVSRTRVREAVEEIVGTLTGELTSAEDTRRISREMVDKGIDLLVFVGGDGTAKDILDAIDQKVPVLGIPSGVKMYSSVFAVSPEAAARVLEAFVRGETVLVEEEVLDIDEEAFRRDKLVVKLYGYLKIPYVRGLVQASKEPSLDVADEVENRMAIARYVVENMEPDTLYILGPGSTVKAIADQLGLSKTLLGVDAVYNGVLVGRDLDEKGLLELLDKYPKAKIIVSPIGGQGFIFGRGNQQISPEVIQRVGGKRNIIVIATHRKIRGIDVLRVDTGDPRIDAMLRNYIRVIIDYNVTILKKIV